MISGPFKRILIIEVNWVGDVLFSTPFIRSMRNRFPAAHIACAVVPGTKEVLEYNPKINELIIYDEKGRDRGLWGKLRFVSLLKKKKFDLAVLLHRSATRAFMAYLGGARERVGYRTGKNKVFLTEWVEISDEHLHKVDYFLKIAELFRGDTSDKNCEFFITDTERNYINKELSKEDIRAGDLLVALNPGGNWKPKRWSEQHFAELADRLIKDYKAKIVITGAKKDLNRAISIRNKMKGNPAIFCGRTNLKELGALFEKSDFVISGDTGPMHIARAMKASVIALFGPTSPDLTGPVGDGNYRVLRKDVGCEIPCYDLTCTEARCMKAITPDDVVKVFRNMHEAHSKKNISRNTQ